MSFKSNCPHCRRTLNVAEPAFGKTVPCPGCKQLIQVPHPTEMPPVAPLQRDALLIGGTENRGAQAPPVKLPPSMPPMSNGPSPVDPSSPLGTESVASTLPRPHDAHVSLPSVMPPPPPVMPPLPESGHVPTLDETDVLLARYRSQGKPMVKERDFFGAKRGSVLAGAGGLVASAIGFLWAQSHAPGNINTVLTGGWVLKQGPYYATMALVLLVGVYGIVNLVRSLISQQNG